MRKSIALTLFAIVLVCIVCASIALSRPGPIDIGVNDSVRDSYNSTCRITLTHPGGEFIGTGVVLNTGYIITAAHCIDINFNGRIDEDERTLEVEFFGDISDIQSATPVLCGYFEDYDFAILEVPEPPHSTVKFVERDLLFGDNVYAIGCHSAQDPHITKGIISTPYNHLGRASMSVWKGNSGGAIWNENQDIVGIVTRVGTIRTYESVRIMIPTHNLIIYMRQAINHPAANWTEFVRASSVMEYLDERNLSFIYSRPKESIYINPYYVAMCLEIMGVLFCVYFIRKCLFG